MDSCEVGFHFSEQNVVCWLRSLSATSVASLRELPEPVELGKPYKALLSHLQQKEPDLGAWKALRPEALVTREPVEIGRHPVTIDEEIPAKLVDREIPNAEVQFTPAPVKPAKKKFSIWGSLLRTAVAFVLLCVGKKRERT